jgi:hypothetical protein
MANSEIGMEDFTSVEIVVMKEVKQVDLRYLFNLPSLVITVTVSATRSSACLQ